MENDHTPVGPRCGNNPNFKLSPGDKAAVDKFMAYLRERAATKQLGHVPVTETTAAYGTSEPLMPDTTPTSDRVTVHYADIECDDGENLRTLSVGDYLELAEPAAGMTPGTWQVVAWHGDDPVFPEEAVMRPVSNAEVLKLRQAASEKFAAITGGNR
ncbi:hypothetical protein ACIQRK_32240 [Streptomyces anulatus]